MRALLLRHDIGEVLSKRVSMQALVFLFIKPKMPSEAIPLLVSSSPNYPQRVTSQSHQHTNLGINFPNCDLLVDTFKPYQTVFISSIHTPVVYDSPAYLHV
jgi:hypothetical protein